MNIPTDIYHYYEKEYGPLRNITEQGMEKAVAIQNNISIGFNSKRPPNYIDLRIRAEQRLRNGFMAKGGKPNINSPHYFTLGECTWVESLYANPGKVIIPLWKIAPEYLSFTYPDSMVSFQFHDEPKLAAYRKECNGQVYRLNEMNSLINKYGIPSEEQWKKEEAKKYDRYIEVQVWDNEIIDEYRSMAE